MGRDFLEAGSTFLSEIQGARFGGYKERDEFKPGEASPIIDEDNIHLIKGIPPLHFIQQGIKYFSTNKTDKEYMNISRFGYVKKGALDLLMKMHNATDFAKNLLDMLEWLNETSGGSKDFDEDSADSDDAFTRQLRQRLLGQFNLMQYKFTSFYGVKTSVSSILFFRREAWIDDSAIDAIVETFQMKYGHRGTYFFIPTQTLHAWVRNERFSGPLAFPWDSYQSTVLAMVGEGKRAREAKQDKEVKVFAVTDMEGHWGALCVDFTKERILFGHSLDKGALPETVPTCVKALKIWLACCGVPTNGWDFDRLDVPQQAGGGSCGINALNAIERYFDPRVEYWTSKRSRYHRVRYLRLLTELAEVCST